MCTSPNYMRYIPFMLRDKKRSKAWQFIPHQNFDKIIDQSLKEDFEFVPVPCGQCLECKMSYSQDWADRCAFEATQYQFNWFITLTYDETHIPVGGKLVRKDVQDFLKRVRKHYDSKIKVFYSGEYGDASLRPHYHLIIFNLPIDDLSEEFLINVNGKDKATLRPSSKGDCFFSKTIFELWHKQGAITISPFTYATATYVAQYVSKKVAGHSKKWYEDNGLTPEFIGMSKGLGANMFKVDLFDEDAKLPIVATTGKARIINHMPRYYEKLFEKNFPSEYIHYKQRMANEKVVSIQAYLNSNKWKEHDNNLRNYVRTKHKKILSRTAV